MVDISWWNLGALIGLVEAALGLVFLVLAQGLPARLLRTITRAIALCLIGAGIILFFNGWRLDPILQVALVLQLVPLGLSLLKDFLLLSERR